MLYPSCSGGQPESNSYLDMQNDPQVSMNAPKNGFEIDPSCWIHDLSAIDSQNRPYQLQEEGRVLHELLT